MFEVLKLKHVSRFILYEQRRTGVSAWFLVGSGRKKYNSWNTMKTKECSNTLKSARVERSLRTYKIDLSMRNLQNLEYFNSNAFLYKTGIIKKVIPTIFITECLTTN